MRWGEARLGWAWQGEAGRARPGWARLGMAGLGKAGVGMSDLGTLLRNIHDQHGILTPSLIVDVARDPEHPLHSRFEWDDTIAAERWRVEQASKLLRIVRLPPDPERPGDLRAFVAVRGQDSPRAEYVPTEIAMADAFSRKLVLADMEREWKALKRRYQHMVEFTQLIRDDMEQTA